MTLRLNTRLEPSLNGKTLFFVGLILCSSGVISPPLALSMGLVFGLCVIHPYSADGRMLSRFLLQASVVGMGFGMNLHDVLRAGRSAFADTAASIAFVLLAGWLTGRLLRVQSTQSFLITAGTAICGGSAIAAIAPIIQADEEETAISLGTIFILNAIALLTFPPIGWTLRLSQQQFGLWSALAIHDTSSVVGATARYGAIALVVGTTVKLTRALWILPLSLAAAAVKRTSSPVRCPWFIVLFCLAVVGNTYMPVFVSLSRALSHLGKLGLTATLYLIGTGISLNTLREVGIRPLLQGVLLWLLVAATSLWLILTKVIS